jgi:DNA-binding transcriptional regulator PaaX
VSLRAWLQRLWGSGGRDDEAAEREEYSLSDRGDAALERSEESSRFSLAEGARAAEDDLAEFKPPSDPAP